MKIGTRSVLFGAHCFLIHWAFVAEGWRRLFGFPWDPRLWVLFFVHDLGYIGKPNMDGPEGETHPILGAQIMHALFDGWEPDSKPPRSTPKRWTNGGPARCWECGQTERQCRRSKCGLRRSMRWHNLALYHSRFLSKQHGQPVSRLCYADKMAICLTPAWLYLPMTRATGELREYMVRSEQKEGAKYSKMVNYASDERQWYENMRAYVGRWVAEHKDGREDTWTPEQGAREPLDQTGVLK